MSLTYNSVSPKQVSYSGVNVNKIYCDGKLVWEKQKTQKTLTLTWMSKMQGTVPSGVSKIVKTVPPYAKAYNLNVTPNSTMYYYYTQGDMYLKCGTQFCAVWGNNAEATVTIYFE